MRHFTFLFLIMICMVFLFESCECNGGDIFIPCSVEEDLGVFENEQDLPYNGYKTQSFINEIGLVRDYGINNPTSLQIYGIDDSRFSNHISPCFETSNGTRFIWQQEQYQGLFGMTRNLGFNIRERLIVDSENPEKGVQGEVIAILFRWKSSGSFGDLPRVSFPINGNELSGNPEFDFGYDFYEKITFNGKEFEDVFAPKSTGDDEILNLYFSKKGELIAFEDAADGIFVVEN